MSGSPNVITPSRRRFLGQAFGSQIQEEVSSMSIREIGSRLGGVQENPEGKGVYHGSKNVLPDLDSDFVQRNYDFDIDNEVFLAVAKKELASRRAEIGALQRKVTRLQKKLEQGKAQKGGGKHE